MGKKTDLEKKIKSCFKYNYFRQTSQLLKAGIHSREIKIAVENGWIIRIKRGLYMLADAYNGLESDLVAITRASKHTVICLASALQFYNLTTYISPKITVGVPNNVSHLKFEYPPVKLYYFDKSTYKVGITRIKTDSGIIRIYDLERTICDAFRFRKELGEDIAVESLINYVKRGDSNISKLMEYASILRIKTVITPYLIPIIISAME
jgi:predicted transcriptional regulator of viral defense system